MRLNLRNMFLNVRLLPNGVAVEIYRLLSIWWRTMMETNSSAMKLTNNNYHAKRSRFPFWCYPWSPFLYYGILWRKIASIIFVSLILLYFTPSIIAECRGNESSKSIQAFNLTAGWSIVGWLIALYLCPLKSWPASERTNLCNSLGCGGCGCWNSYMASIDLDSCN